MNPEGEHEPVLRAGTGCQKTARSLCEPGLGNKWFGMRFGVEAMLGNLRPNSAFLKCPSAPNEISKTFQLGPSTL